MPWSRYLPESACHSTATALVRNNASSSQHSVRSSRDQAAAGGPEASAVPWRRTVLVASQMATPPRNSSPPPTEYPEGAESISRKNIATLAAIQVDSQAGVGAGVGCIRGDSPGTGNVAGL